MSRTRRGSSSSRQAFVMVKPPPADLLARASVRKLFTAVHEACLDPRKVALREYGMGGHDGEGTASGDRDGDTDGDGGDSSNDGATDGAGVTRLKALLEQVREQVGDQGVRWVTTMPMLVTDAPRRTAGTYTYRGIKVPLGVKHQRPLHVAAAHSAAIVEVLLAAAPQVAFFKDDNGMLPLHYACVGAQERSVAMLLAAVAARPTRGLVGAGASSSVSKWRLTGGVGDSEGSGGGGGGGGGSDKDAADASVPAIEADGGVVAAATAQSRPQLLTPLHVACMHGGSGQAGVVAQLLAVPTVDVCATDIEGNTALMCLAQAASAATPARLDVARLLLAANPRVCLSPEPADDPGRTAVASASAASASSLAGRGVSVAEYLVAKPGSHAPLLAVMAQACPAILRGALGTRLLLAVALYGHVDEIRALTSAAPDRAASASNNHGVTMLHNAARRGEPDAVRAVLEVAPELVHARTKNFGSTPLHDCSLPDAPEVAEVLLGASVDELYVKVHAFTPLDLAVARGRPRLARILRARLSGEWRLPLMIAMWGDARIRRSVRAARARRAADAPSDHDEGGGGGGADAGGDTPFGKLAVWQSLPRGVVADVLQLWVPPPPLDDDDDAMH